MQIISSLSGHINKSQAVCDGACASSPNNYHPNRTGRILVKARHMLYLEIRHFTKMPVLFEIIHFNMGIGLHLSQLSFLNHLSNFSTTHYVCVAVIIQYNSYHMWCCMIIVFPCSLLFSPILFKLKHMYANETSRLQQEVGSINTTIILISYIQP